MGALRFLSRVAFICNVCFLFAMFSQWIPLPQLPDNALTSDIVTLGLVVSVVVNVIVNTALLIVLLVGRIRKTGIAAWLLIVNFLFFVLQIIILILNRNLR